MMTVLTAVPPPPPSRARLRTGALVPAPPQAQPGVERDEDGLLWLLPTHQDSPPTGYYASSMHDVRLSDGAMRLLPIEQPAPGASVFGGGGDVEDEEEDVYRYARQHAEQVALEQQEQARQQRRAHERSYRRRKSPLVGRWRLVGSGGTAGYPTGSGCPPGRLYAGRRSREAARLHCPR